ncbi:MBL fold metallo-hydrolase [Fretibacter rubidus]|uniref:MBL fold metallo-hydrolase n=1 Tax=Fretibacter rubidus TaxID=570162 RepID=UPI00352B45C6
MTDPRTIPAKSRKTAHDESLTTPRDNSSKLLSFIMDTPPDNGSVTEVADGVFWLRFPLPMSGLNHINLWAIKDGDGWVVVDTGVGNRDSKDIWAKHFSGLMGGRPVNRVIVTHLHPDHSGLAGWITRKFQAPLLMTRGEYFLCRLMAADTGQAAPREGLRFYRKAGYTEQQLELYKMRFGGFGKAITPMPHSYDRIEDGDVIKIGGRDWRVIVGAGHSPEHACLWCEELSIVLSGDQILPNISSNVSVWPTEPEANPLGDWIDSCVKLRGILPEDTLCCPAHGIPFRGVHRRLSKLIDHHEKALSRLYDYCRTPMLSTEVYPVLFRRAINDGNRIMAVGESIAHLNCLKERGMITRRLNDAGQFTYKSVPPHKIPGYKAPSE